jgi:hypothetical protein
MKVILRLFLCARFFFDADGVREDPATLAWVVMSFRQCRENCFDAG